MLRTLVVLISVALTGDAFAFQIETPITAGCHEKITIEAMRAAGFPDLAQAPAPTEDQRRARNDLTFTLPPENDVWTMSILLGLRSNDIQDIQLTDVAGLVHIHDDPEDQPAHCIRGFDDDHEEGDVTALAACRAFIVGELDAGRFFIDTMDLSSSERVKLFLAFRHQVEIELPRFAYRLGRALHALEDGFAHSMRNPTDGAVRHVTNWIDYATSLDYSSSRDGFGHFSTIDDCLRDSDIERRHVDRAREAVTALLAAVADRSGTGAERRARVEVVLDSAFAREPGCDYSNNYCNAEELTEISVGCASTSGSGGLFALVLAALVVILRRRKMGSAPCSCRP